MGEVVNLGEWRKGRENRIVPALEAASGVRAHPAGQRAEPDEVGGVKRLERAVERLHELVSQKLDGAGHVKPQVETELLAIMGELTMGMVTEAAVRAERLVDRLAGSSMG